MNRSMRLFGVRSFGRAPLALLVLALLAWTSAPALQAAPTDNKGGSGGGGPRLAGEDGVGTLPFTWTPPTGLVLTGTPADLVATVVGVSGVPEGVLELEGGRWAVFFGHGSLVELDRQALVTTGARAFLSPGATFDGARGLLSSGDALLSSFQLDATAPLALPLGEVFGPTSGVPALTLDAVAETGDGTLLRHRTILAPQGAVLRIGQMTIGG